MPCKGERWYFWSPGSDCQFGEGWCVPTAQRADTLTGYSRFLCACLLLSCLGIWATPVHSLRAHFTNIFEMIFRCSSLHIALLTEQSTLLLLLPKCQSSSWPTPPRVANTLINGKILCWDGNWVEIFCSCSDIHGFNSRWPWGSLVEPWQISLPEVFTKPV